MTVLRRSISAGLQLEGVDRVQLDGVICECKWVMGMRGETLTDAQDFGSWTELRREQHVVPERGDLRGHEAWEGLYHQFAIGIGLVMELFC